MEDVISTDERSQLPLARSVDVPCLSIRTTVGGSGITGSPGAKLWRSAFQKVKSRTSRLDPWKNFSLEETPTMAAVRHRYSALKKKWIKDNIFVKLESMPFNRGAMRECFRLKKVPDNGDWHSASNYVAKRYISPVTSSVYLDDVRLQMEAKLWSEAFNKQDPPKKVDVFQMSVIEVLHEVADSPLLNCESKRRTSVTMFNPACTKSDVPTTSQFFHIERFMDGEYRKYNSNSGYVDETLRNTPQAFSHFTFERSGHRLLVVDIQGVGDLYTDPQIHTADGVGYNDGNLGLRGMALFFHSHRCNPLCAYLGLTPFDLSASEVNVLFDGEEEEEEQGAELDSPNPLPFLDSDDEEAVEEDDILSGNTSLSPPDRPCRRIQPAGSNHYQQASSVSTSTRLFPLQHRKRSLSFGMMPFDASPSPSLSSCYRSKSKHLYGPTVTREEEFLLAPRFRARSGCYSASVRSMESRERHRHASGDSGAQVMHRLHSTSTEPSEWDDNESPYVPDAVFDLDSGFSWEDEGVTNFRFPPQQQIYRGRVRTRTASESSDMDGGVSLHQALHETQKPASAAHPSNLDQEIGQSVLGQLHHELARLHEAGRFMKRPCGGWSNNGLGGLKLDDDGGATDGDERHCDALDNHSLDWESVLFHERLAAQLGCLEALIIMAHYYLGLGTQLLCDCPIKPRDEDLSLGVDYLWRSSEGGDRRCMILLARYVDASIIFGDDSSATATTLDRSVIKSALNLRTTPVDDFLALLCAHRCRFPVPAGYAGRPWAEAAAWYRRAIDNAGSRPSPGNSATDAAVDEGFDAEGRYDAAEDLSPVHRLVARLAEMYEVGGHGLEADPSMAGDLYTEAAESAIQQSNGRLASRYFELADEAYAKVED